MDCTNLDLLNILRLVRIAINIITIIVPAILVLFIILDIVKTTSSGDVDTKKLFKSISKRIIAALMIFLAPYIINVALSFFTDKSYYLNCYNNANTEYINGTAESLALTAIDEAKNTCSNKPNYALYEKARKAVSEIPNKEIRESYKDEIDNLKTICGAK